MPCNFFYSNFFGRGGGGLKLGLYVFHHNNNFNLINIYSAKTFTIEYKKNDGSIYDVNKTIISFQIHFLFFKSNSSDLTLEALRGGSQIDPPPRFFWLKFLLLDRLSKALAQLFLVCEQIF